MPTTQPSNAPSTYSSGAAGASSGKHTIKVPKVVNGITTEVEVEVGPDTGLAWGPNSKHRLLNSPLPRADGPAKATGTAIYTYDVRLPGMLHGRILCSPHACATVKKIDTSAAEKMPGVKGVIVLFHQDPPQVSYEGQPIAALAATTVELAEDAIRAISVEYEVLKHVVTGDDALKPGAPKVFRRPRAAKGGGNEAQTNDALSKCDAVVAAEYRTPILHHSCLETHGVTVDYRGGNSATVYVSTQGTFTILQDAPHELGLPQNAVTGVVQNMGGGFGSKFGIGVTGQAACRLSKQIGAPVKMMFTRREEFLAAGNGPGSIQKVKAGANKDGTLVALHAVQYGLAGIGGSGIAPLPYQYHAEHVYRLFNSLGTNEDSSCALRAPGHPQASFAMESLMDELAEKIGMDPIEFRKKNANDPAWHRQLDVGAKAIGWERRNKTPGAGGRLLRGIGCGIGAWGGGGHPECEVTVNIQQDGAVTVEVGSQDLGTGTRTYIRAIVAEELGLDYDDVQEKIGNTKYGAANASGGSTTAASLAPAVKDAAYNARLAMAQRVAPLLGGNEKDNVSFAERNVIVNGKTLGWKQACAALPAGGITAHGVWQRALSGNGAHGASFAEVEVDMETGYIRPIKMVHVQDGGLPLNRAAFQSQINGGMIQSMGMALYEGRVMDAYLGVMLNPDFGDYKLAGALEMPELVPIIDDGDDRQVVIGVAEPANIPGVGAVANAVYNACGVRVRSTPITPDKILDGLAKKKNG